MKKLLLLLALLLVVVGCSKSEITISNYAAAGVRFHFRGEVYDIASGGVATIEKIPDGEFTYTTIYSLPDGIKKSTESGLSGNLSFSQHGTIYTADYVSSFPDSTTYKIEFTYSSNTGGTNIKKTTTTK